MTAAQRRYVAIEAAIGAAISGLLSILFAVAIFGGSIRVPVTGRSGLIVDAIPQGFAIAFMATLVPTLLTRRRLALGRIAPRAARSGAPSLPCVVQALGVALIGAVATVALTALLLLGRMHDLPVSAVLLGKTVWGSVLGGCVAAIMTRAALACR